MFQFGILLLLECVCLNIAYNKSDLLLNKLSEKYKNITPSHKKKYVLSNFFKGTILFILSPLTIDFLYNHIFNNEWNRSFLFLYGSMYTSLDLVSILKVPKLPMTTIFHHITVCLFYFYVVYTNMEKRSLSRLIVMYGTFSSMAAIVNIFLALRVLYKPSIYKTMRRLAVFSYINYILCCIPNWTYQFYYLFIDLTILNLYGVCSIFIYSITLLILIRDDLILIRYLYQLANSKSIENLL